MYFEVHGSFEIGATLANANRFQGYNIERPFFRQIMPKLQGVFKPEKRPGRVQNRHRKAHWWHRHKGRLETFKDEDSSSSSNANVSTENCSAQFRRNLQLNFAKVYFIVFVLRNVVLFRVVLEDIICLNGVDHFLNGDSTPDSAKFLLFGTIFKSCCSGILFTCSHLLTRVYFLREL